MVSYLGFAPTVHPTFAPRDRHPSSKPGNRTYQFSYGLGAVIVLYGLLLCLHPWLPQVAAVGSFLVFGMSFVTLSFLVTTPECWVPPLGDAQHRFPYLIHVPAGGD